MPTASKKRRVSATKHALMERRRAFLARRPHRSFRRTRRRDYVRPLELPGLIAFSTEVTRLLWKHKTTFFALAGVYAVLSVFLVGIQSQELYTTLRDTLQQTSAGIFDGIGGAIGQASLLFASLSTPAFGTDGSEAQQIFAVILFMMMWLTTVWLLRNILAGHTVKMRDGLYNAGAPFFSMVYIVLLLAVQLLPAALAVIGYSAAHQSGLLDSGIAAMLFWVVALLLGVLSLYWVSSSIFALIIITLPGMYPYQAIKTAGDMMLGRRIRILLRWAWLGVVVVVSGFVSIVPVILVDMWMTNSFPVLEWVPLVPMAVVAWSACAIIWSAAYMYILYRKVVENVSE